VLPLSSATICPQRRRLVFTAASVYHTDSENCREPTDSKERG